METSALARCTLARCTVCTVMGCAIFWRGIAHCNNLSYLGLSVIVNFKGRVYSAGL